MYRVPLSSKNCSGEFLVRFLPHGGSCIVHTLNCTSFHMRLLVRYEFIGQCVWVSVNFTGQCRLFLDNQNIRKRNHTDSISLVNWVEGLKTIEVAEEIL
jgi:hypothetical protein